MANRDHALPNPNEAFEVEPPRSVQRIAARDVVIALAVALCAAGLVGRATGYDLGQALADWRLPVAVAIGVVAGFMFVLTSVLFVENERAGRRVDRLMDHAVRRQREIDEALKAWRAER